LVSPGTTTAYTLTVTNALGTLASSTATVTVIQAPTISSFVAGPAAITAGGTTSLTGNFANGSGVITPGNIAVTSGAKTLVSPGTTTAYSLTVTNALGVLASSTATVTVVPAPAISSFTLSPPSLGPGGTVTFSSSYTNGTAAITAGTSTSPLSGNTDKPVVSTTYTLTVTNSIGTAVSATARALVGSLATYVGTPSGIGNVDGTGSHARFFGPVSSAMDDAGNVFVVDRFNNTIRWISPSPAFVVTTIAGTPSVAGFADSMEPATTGSARSPPRPAPCCR
jgi:hypothetical protein